MSDKNPLNPDSKDPQGAGKDPNFNWRGLILLSIAMLLIAVAFIYTGSKGRMQELEYSKLIQLLEQSQQAKDPKALQEGTAPKDPFLVDDKAKRIKLVQKPATGEHYVEGWYNSDTLSEASTEMASENAKGARSPLVHFRTTVNPFFSAEQLWAAFAAAEITPDQPHELSMWASPVMHFLPILLIVLLL